MRDTDDPHLYWSCDRKQGGLEIRKSPIAAELWERVLQKEGISGANLEVSRTKDLRNEE